MAHPLAGKPQTPEHIAKRIAARRANGTYRGWMGSPENKRRITSEEAKAMRQAQGPSSFNWKGDAVGQQGAHYRAKKKLKGQPCAHCGSLRHVQAALRADRLKKWDAKYECWYSPDPADYMPLCPSCHQIYDQAHREERRHG